MYRSYLSQSKWFYGNFQFLLNFSLLKWKFIRSLSVTVGDHLGLLFVLSIGLSLRLILYLLNSSFMICLVSVSFESKGCVICLSLKETLEFCGDFWYKVESGVLKWSRWVGERLPYKFFFCSGEIEWFFCLLLRRLYIPFNLLDLRLVLRLNGLGTVGFRKFRTKSSWLWSFDFDFVLWRGEPKQLQGSNDWNFFCIFITLIKNPLYFKTKILLPHIQTPLENKLILNNSKTSYLIDTLFAK